MRRPIHAWVYCPGSLPPEDLDILSRSWDSSVRDSMRCGDQKASPREASTGTVEQSLRCPQCLLRSGSDAQQRYETVKVRLAGMHDKDRAA